MELFASIGIVCVMLAAVIALVLPMCLALWVAPPWLWLYLVYAVVAGLFIRLSVTVKSGDNDDDEA